MIFNILKENRTKILTAVLNIICLVALIYIFALLVSSEYIETERAEIEVRRDIINLTAYLFRNEEIIYADAGDIIYLLENGEKTARNQAVARVNQGIREDSADLVRTEIADIENKLDILRKSNINLEYAAASITQLNKDSNDLYIETLKNIEYKRIREAGRHRDEKLVLLNKRQLITGDAENFSGIISGYAERRRELESPAVSGAPVNAQRSGIFYKRADGYENYFTGEAARALDFNIFDELIKKERDEDIINRAAGKIAYDYNWFFACKVPERELLDISFTEGASYDIICPYSANKIISFTLRSLRTSAGEVLLVFETNISPADFNYLRRQTVQIVSREIRGIRVPDEAVVVRQVRRSWEADADGELREIIEIIEDPSMTDGELILGETVTGVYVISGSEVIFKRLDGRDLIARFDGYALYAEPAERAEGSITSLQAFDDIITAGKNLHHGKIIK